MNQPLRVVADFSPAGDQPRAIARLVEGIQQGERDQVLLGVTGSGKTFTMAHVIETLQRPAIILAHNKTLAAQLYSEMKEFFPDNAVEYFVSYYDYYQPEAYIPKTDVFIEKDASINEHIDLLRHSATRSLLERKDVIVVASVSCIYGLGSPELYLQMTVPLKKGQQKALTELMRELTEIQYSRNDIAFERGTFRLRGDTLDIFPSHYEDRAWRLSFFGNTIDAIYEFDPLTGEHLMSLDTVTIFANSHYVTPRPTIKQAITFIREELKERLALLKGQSRLLEAQRLEQRTYFDLEMLEMTGSCKGIENYSRYLAGRKAGEPPPTLFEYLPENALLFVDESHVTIPQIGGMYKGDRSRKTTLVEHGFRLPSACDNRPLQFEEWDHMRPQTVYVSATPGPFEFAQTKGVFIEQVIRPTGLVDPVCEVRPAETQVDDLLDAAKKVIARGYRVLVTALTKKMAEDLSEYMQELGIKVTYLHSDITTLERVKIIHQLRQGEIDVLVGVNLLREGLDIPECGLVAILDADKEGFLRSATSLIQTIGRAARNIEGKVILYADKMTGSLKQALEETDRRRKVQEAHNKKYHITPESIKKSLPPSLRALSELQEGKSPFRTAVVRGGKNLQESINEVKQKMFKAAENLEFEEAAALRDELFMLEKQQLLLA